jgi:hypothetical protein
LNFFCVARPIFAPIAEISSAGKRGDLDCSSRSFAYYEHFGLLRQFVVGIGHVGLGSTSDMNNYLARPTWRDAVRDDAEFSNYGVVV